MVKNVTDTTCFLCGSPAVATDTDRGNRKLYRCSNSDCGDYEISRTAMRRLENSAGHKADLVERVHSYRGSGKLLEIIVGPDNQVIAQSRAA
jgi:ssDNA-binding Zn-finger/Zn-ribbon topoisomerase 1